MSAIGSAGMSGHGRRFAGVAALTCMTMTATAAQAVDVPGESASPAARANVQQVVHQPPRHRPHATRVTHHIVRVSVTSRETQANGDTWQVFVSDSGKLAAFTSAARNLVPGDRNRQPDVFVRRVDAGTTRRISLTPDGTRIRRGAGVTGLTPDGRYVLLDVQQRFFQTRVMVQNEASNRASWVTGTFGGGVRGAGSLGISNDGRIVLATDEYDLFLVNRALHRTRGGPTARFWAALAVLSGDGRWMAFASQEVRHAQLYVRDRFAGRRILVSRGRDGRPARGDTTYSSLSEHGRFIAFSSTARNLVVGDTNGASDVFVRDRALHRTNMLTRGGGAGVRNQGSFDPDISADGRYVAFTSAAGNLVRRDTNGRPDVFVRDRHTGTTCLVSVGLDGVCGRSQPGDLGRRAVHRVSVRGGQPGTARHQPPRRRFRRPRPSPLLTPELREAVGSRWPGSTVFPQFRGGGERAQS